MGEFASCSDQSADPTLTTLERLLPELEALYKDVHSHPELSMHETRTAGIVAQRLIDDGFEVTTNVGKTGVVGLLRNGEGRTVMLRADMDALPIEETTGLPCASKATADAAGKQVPVGHMCGHDMLVTWLAGASKLLAAPGFVAGNTDGGLPARRRNGGRCASDDRRRPFHPLSEARRDVRSARHGRTCRYRRRSGGGDHFCGGQFADPSIRCGNNHNSSTSAKHKTSGR